MTFSYRDLLDAASAIVAGDTHGANAWLLRVASTLKDRDLILQPHQRAYLYRLRGIWKRRAAGLDPRWNEWGSLAGKRPPKRSAAQRAAVRPIRAPQPLPVVVTDPPSSQTERVNAQPNVAAKPAIADLVNKYR